MNMIDKIAALLAKSAGTDNEHEQAAFAAKARELMEKHGLSETDVVKDKLSIGVDEFHTLTDLKWQTSLVTATCTYFDVLATTRRDFKYMRYSFYGRKSNRVTAEMMLPYVFEQVRRQAEQLMIATGQTRGAAQRAIGLALVSRLQTEYSKEVRDFAEADGVIFGSTKFKFNGKAKAYADKISMNRQAGTSAVKAISG